MDGPAVALVSAADSVDVKVGMTIVTFPSRKLKVVVEATGRSAPFCCGLSVLSRFLIFPIIG